MVTTGYIAGLADGEGCFEITVYKRRGGFRIRPEFRLTLFNEGIEALHKIRRYFGFGRTYIYDTRWGTKGGIYVVVGKSDQRKLKSFFGENPLIAKREAFKIWSKAVDVSEETKGSKNKEERRDKFIKLARLREDILKHVAHKKRKYSFQDLVSTLDNKLHVSE